MLTQVEIRFVLLITRELLKAFHPIVRNVVQHIDFEIFRFADGITVLPGR